MWSALFILGFTFTGFSHIPDPGSVIEKRFQCMNRHDLPAMENLYDASSIGYSVGWPDTAVGVKAIIEKYKRYFISTPDLYYQIIHTYTTTAGIVVEYTSGGTLTKNETGVPAEWLGKKYTLRNCTIFQVKNDKIIMESSYFDQVSFLKQMGYFK